MPLIRTNKLPPGGWIYDQKNPDGTILKKFTSMSPFEDVAREILAVRTANNLPGADFASVSRDLDEAQCIRLGYDSTYCDSGVKKNFPSSLRRVLDPAARAAGVVKKLTNGVQILKDWLGDGAKTVPAEMAQSRADVCTGRLSGRPCPHNVNGGFSITAEIAKTIHEQVEQKNHLSLRVEGEDKLFSCNVCLCHLPLKVQVPFDTIAARTPEPVWQDLPSFCWMKRERHPADPVPEPSTPAVNDTPDRSPTVLQ